MLDWHSVLSTYKGQPSPSTGRHCTHPLRKKYFFFPYSSRHHLKMYGFELLQQTICVVPGIRVNVEMREAGGRGRLQTRKGPQGPPSAACMAGDLSCNLRPQERGRPSVCAPQARALHTATAEGWVTFKPGDLGQVPDLLCTSVTSTHEVMASFR